VTAARTLGSLVVLAGAALGCAPKGPSHVAVPRVEGPASAAEPLARVTAIPLAAPLDERRAELSSLAWYGESLILLPQYPQRFATRGVGAVFSLPKRALLERIDGVAPEGLAPVPLPFDSAGIETTLPGFNGFEAIVFDGDRVFLTIEVRQGKSTTGYLVRGDVTPGPRIVLEPKTLVALTPPVVVPNLGFEALTRFDGALLAFYEANGAAIVSNPVVRRFTPELVELPPFPLEHVDSRITDATRVDALGRFWVMNFYWPGEPELARPGDDARTRAIAVEQLVELEIHDGRVARTPRPPVRLEPVAHGESRNWEGLVRLDAHHFLAVTDEHPETILAVVSVPEGAR
jgi:hypothetical protein